MVGWYSASSDMTVEKCQATCLLHNYTLAGLEYFFECFVSKSAIFACRSAKLYYSAQINWLLWVATVLRYQFHNVIMLAKEIKLKDVEQQTGNTTNCYVSHLYLLIICFPY